MHCNHSKSFVFISMRPTDCNKTSEFCFSLQVSVLLTVLTGWTCEGSKVALTGGDVVPGYNTISTPGTAGPLARGRFTTICTIQRYSPHHRQLGPSPHHSEVRVSQSQVRIHDMLFFEIPPNLFRFTPHSTQ